MAGPSKSVQGGYLGYSALTDSYWNTLSRIRKGNTERLEQEKLELQNEDAINNMFALQPAPASQPVRSSARGGNAPTVVTNNGFSYTANINDPKLMEFITPQQVDPTDPAALAMDNYRKNVSQQQKELFKGQEFSLDGSSLPAGGGFNSALQFALEGLKGDYVKAGRKTSARKRREERLGIRNQLQALNAFSQEVQGIQGAYKQAYENGLISYGTKSEYIDFLNTVSGPNDLEVVWDNGRGFLVGTSAAGKDVRMPLDNLEGLKNGLVLKQNSPAPVIDQLVQQVNKVNETVDERGVKVQSNEWTEETTNNVQNALAQLLPDSNSVLSMGIDWLGFNGVAWKNKVASDPEGAKQIVLDTLAAHVKSQHVPTQKGGLTEDQYVDNQLAAEKFEETKRHNRVTEANARNRQTKPETTPETASDIASNLTNPSFWGNKKLEGGEILKSNVRDGILELTYKTGTAKGSPTGQTRRYNLQDDNDVERLIYDTYGSKAVDIIQEMKAAGTMQSGPSQETIFSPSNVLGTNAPAPVKSNQSDAAKRAAELIAKHRK